MVRVAYSRDGAFIVVGFEGGYMNIVETSELSDVHSGRNTSATITALACSTSGDQVAMADSVHHVLLYSCLPHKHTNRWEFVGRTQTHHDRVVGLAFGESPSGQTRLFSLGADSRMAEYDLDGSVPASGLKILRHLDLPPTITPSALAFAPPVQYFRHSSAETMLLACDEQYKVRMINADTQSQVTTFLGPTFGGPVSKLIMFKSSTSEDAFLAYLTKERVVGLLAWPMDGDPARTMGLIAHPGAITAMAVSYDGRKLLTAGADGTLAVWDITATALTRSAADGGAQRWENVLADPQLVEEMREYFLYAQIKAQGEDCMAPRATPGTIPASMLPEMMCAAGFYPTQAEIAVMRSHLAFMAASRNLDVIEDVSFEDFLCLYANHRPLSDATHDDIVQAFSAMGANPNNGKLTRDQLLGLLQQVGEAMAVEELTAALEKLTGAKKLTKSMPHTIDAGTFSADVLGFDREANPPPPQADVSPA